MDVFRMIESAHTISEYHFYKCVEAYVSGAKRDKRGARRMLILGDKRAPRSKDDSIVALILACLADAEKRERYTRETEIFPRRADRENWIAKTESEALRSGLALETLDDDLAVSNRALAALDGLGKRSAGNRRSYGFDHVEPTANEANSGTWFSTEFERRERALGEADRPVCAFEADRQSAAMRGARSESEANEALKRRADGFEADRDARAFEAHKAKAERRAAKRALMSELRRAQADEREMARRAFLRDSTAD